MNHSTPGLTVHHQLPESTQTHVHQVSDAIQPSHPLSSPSPLAPNPSQHQGLFQWVNSSYEVAKVLEFQLQRQSFQWTPRTDLLQDGLVGSPCSPRDSQESSQHHSSKASIFWCSAFFTVQLSHPYMTTGKTIALTRQTFVGKVMSLLFNVLSRLVITFLPRSRRLLISWLQSPSAVILEPPLQKKTWHFFHCFPSVSHELMEPDAMILVFWMLSFEPTFSLSSLTFIKRLFSSSSLSAIRVVLSAYLRLLIFLPETLIPASASSSPVFLIFIIFYYFTYLEAVCSSMSISNYCLNDLKRAMIYLLRDLSSATALMNSLLHFPSCFWYVRVIVQVCKTSELNIIV